MATVLLVAATQTIGVSEAAGDLTRRDASSDFELVGADPGAEPFPSVLYGGLMWSVTGSRPTPAPELLSPAIVEVDLNITNTLSDTQLRVPDSMVGLVALDREAETGGRFVGAGSHLSIEPGQTVEVTATFKIGFSEDPDPAALGLRVWETSRIPAIIPLDGELPPGNDDYPIMAAIGTSPAVLVDPDDRTRQIVIEPQAVAIDINAGAYRAAEGERLAVVQVLVQRTSSNDTSGFLDTDYWAMEAAGEPVAPILAARTDQPASNADQVTLLFAFPAAAVTDLNLVASANSDDGANFPIVVPR